MAGLTPDPLKILDRLLSTHIRLISRRDDLTAQIETRGRNRSPQGLIFMPWFDDSNLLRLQVFEMLEWELELSYGWMFQGIFSPKFIVFAACVAGDRILKEVMIVTNQTFIKNDTEYPWEYEPGEEGREDVVRWRTLLSGEKPPTEGISMGTLEIPPGASLNAHHHSPLEVCYLTSGEGRLLCGDTVKHARAGDVVYIPANQVHGIKNIGDHRLVLVWMFPTDTWSEIEYHDDHVHLLIEFTKPEKEERKKAHS